MKRIVFASCLALASYMMVSCNSGTTTENKDAVDSAKAVNKEQKPVDKSVSDFAVKATSGGIMEVELGKIAAQKAVNPRVKAFGQMMVDDHSKANDDLKSRAAMENITLPSNMSDDQQKMVDNVNKKTGKDFDKEYMDMMLNGHKDVLDMFQKASADLSDSTIKEFATNTIPAIQKHLDSARAITGKK
ncbi:DUF4142 domain-containing protein [Pinibacter aurantiacus]|uniref:DUF4142 domain-containing protein n=1 Tax=Pinibacter aurantiacus TaxID=2851599 RepID=A0A9E2SDE1_9BACT|nr:DUF4142 domain-containing protein [Pinibacter aurantiacus]MBV4359317.1 DUF4142 domain-containing protein [Pinibacter aurantiacus]